MPEISFYSASGQDLGKLALPEDIFGIEPNPHVLHQAVLAEEANSRQGTHSTKTRADVRGGGRKPWRQKGTGRARQGSIRSPQWTHGGIVFGPHPRSYRKSFPKKMRVLAMRSALSAKVADGEMIGLNAFKLEAISTKTAAGVLNTLPLTKTANVKNRQGSEIVRTTAERTQRVLVIVPEYDEVLLKSVRNIPNVTLRYAPNFSVRDVVSAARIVLAEGAVAAIQEVWSK